MDQFIIQAMENETWCRMFLAALKGKGISFSEDPTLLDHEEMKRTIIEIFKELSKREMH